MPRSVNAQLAVDLYERLRRDFGWTSVNAWHGIARLLLTCNVWGTGWRPFHGVVVYRESNNFKMLASGTKNAVLRRAEDLSQYLASELGIARENLCDEIGVYFREAHLSALQPHNLFGHAFRSLIVTVLQDFGDPGLTYQEEVDPFIEFPGYSFATRSRAAKLDIVARRDGLLVALISARWRFRHDRVDVVEEAMSYAPAARRVNLNSKLYAVLGEFDPNRLDKVISNCPPIQPTGALTAAVHFAPQLLIEGLKQNGRMACLRDLEWLIKQTYDWR